MDKIMWTLVAKIGTSLQTVGTFDTKRAAVLAMEAKRQPKTAIMRDGHTFIFQPSER